VAARGRHFETVMLTLLPTVFATTALQLAGWFRAGADVASGTMSRPPAATAVTKRWHQLPATGAVCGAVLVLCVQFGALSGIRPEPVEEMAALVATHRTQDERVGEYQVFVRNLVFYSRFKQEELYDEGRALDFVKSSERVLMLVRASDLPRIESVAGTTLTRLGEVRYLNTTSLKLRMLLWPMPDQDLETVLLVTNR